MSTFPNTPRLLKGGIVLLDPESGAVLCIIALQYNPDILSRTLQPQAVKEAGDRSEVLRWKAQLAAALKLGPKVNPMNQFRAPMQLTREGNR
jgi:hypothetical protein